MLLGHRFQSLYFSKVSFCSSVEGCREFFFISVQQFQQFCDLAVKFCTFFIRNYVSIIQLFKCIHYCTAFRSTNIYHKALAKSRLFSSITLFYKNINMEKITCNSRCFKLTYNKINYDKEKFAEYLHLRLNIKMVTIIKV